MLIRQSHIASWSRCPQQAHLRDVAADEGRREQVLSATAFGTVIHHAVQVMETLHVEGRDDACERAVETFEYYWHPDNIDALVPGGVDVWLPRQTYGGLLIRARSNIRTYYDYMRRDHGQLLALEVSFNQPIVIDGRLHTAKGQIDRLDLKASGKNVWLSVDDFKSGKKPNFLRHAFQWTYYSWATLQRAFWQQWEPDHLAEITAPLTKRGLALYDDGSGLPIIPRRGRWIALRDTFGVHDCGWRNGSDFARMYVALAEYVRSNEAQIYPLSITGDNCTYCPYAYDGTCGGVPLSDADDGAPYQSGITHARAGSHVVAAVPA